MTSENEQPRVGTGVWVRKGGKILVGFRVGKFAHGLWCLPGGKLDLNEDPFENAVRETREEAGIEIGNVRFMTFTNDVTPDSHYVTLNFVADWVSGEPRDEVGKIGQWGWYEWGKLPQPLFWSDENFLKKGINPLEFNG